MKLKHVISMIISAVLLTLTLVLTSCGCKHEWALTNIKTRSTCTVAGEGSHRCQKCGIEEDCSLPLAKHKGITVIPPSCTEKGYTIINCPDCGHLERTDSTDPIGHDTKTSLLACSRCHMPSGSDNIFVKFLESALNDQSRVLIKGVEIDENTTIDTLELSVFNQDGRMRGAGVAKLKQKVYSKEEWRYVYVDSTYYASLEGDAIYIDAAPYTIEIPIKAVVTEIKSGVDDEMKSEIYEWLEENISEKLDIEKYFSEKAFNSAICYVLDYVLTANRTDNVYNVHIDYAKIKNYVRRLGNEKFSEFIDKEFGYGSFNKLKNFIISLPDMSMLDIIDTLASYGVTLDSMNALVEILTGTEGATLSDIFSGADLESLLSEESFLRTTVGEQIIRSTQKNLTVSQVQTAVAELRKTFSETASILEDKSIYVLMGIPETNIDDGIKEFENQINALSRELDFYFSATVAGKMQQIYYKNGKSSLTVTYGAAYTGDVSYIKDNAIAHKNVMLTGPQTLTRENGSEGEYPYSTEEYSFIVDESGALIGIAVKLTEITRDLTNLITSEKDGKKYTHSFYDVQETVISYVIPVGDKINVYAHAPHCGDWIIYNATAITEINTVQKTYTLVETGEKVGNNVEIIDEKISESTVRNKNSTVVDLGGLIFLYNTEEGLVAFADSDVHSWSFTRTVPATTCKIYDGYDLYTCTVCTTTKEENPQNADHIPDEVGRCIYCSDAVGNPDTAIYIFTAPDGTYYEFFEGGKGYMYIPYFDEDYNQHAMYWENEDGIIWVYTESSYDSKFIIDENGDLVQIEKVDRTN